MDERLEPLGSDIEALLQPARVQQPLDPQRKRALRRRLDDTLAAPMQPPRSPRPTAHEAPHAPQASNPRRRGWAAISFVSAAAAGLVLWLGLSANAPVEGSISLQARVSVPLADRGVMVAEPNTHASWSVEPDGTAVVQQRSGRAFYRVEPGRPFSVQTPTAAVRVVGTSFEVEIGSMDRTTMKSGFVGAALAAVTVVSVYEGKVMVANAHGEVEVEAGQRATVTADASPMTANDRRETPAEPTPAAPAVAVATAAQPPAEVQSLRRRVRELERELTTAREEAAAKAEDDDHDWAAKFRRQMFEPTEEDLRADVKKCAVKYAAPSVQTHGDRQPLADDLVDKLDLSEDEQRFVEALFTELDQQLLPLTRELYIEATGDEAGATTLSFDAMENEIQDKTPPEEVIEARRQVARERAGMDAVPTDPSDSLPLTRLLRAHVARSKHLNQRMLAEFGPDRGRELRNGLPLNYTSLGGCSPGDVD
ncbi:MAG: FecR domain-containing protein [Deltaproteobacteria bacterium]|nr:FecR domain-containing protein [Deltaproteobacteria bacterium]